ncbi:MAG: 4-(cytidine 5'-diphospho)-2-C-methyl-D-erythritol kinase [Pseudarcicella sp.]|nr:4-(cytidine 5'-diphospho)-2-C-methyl-D-erythritol kinase [Pseudarcicella sp.]MBP6410899.1 4-(cytidine 5'-diphospho)-2-C-methyl-D-erythritol kinase [Pseudarcicella sp.]
MIVFPNAKINLGLHITSKRSDGYHELETCMYPIAWQDAMEILPSEKTRFEALGLDIPGETQNNVCLKAYQLIANDYPLMPLEIILQKNIPIGAGLGGGSADAAFTIRAINTYFELNLSVQQMESYTKKIGADCAFFIQNKPQLCYGIGDVFENCDVSLNEKYIVLVYPNLHISTAEAYAGVVPKKPALNLKECLSRPIEEWKEILKNDFEDSIFPQYPILASIKKDFYNLGAIYASMSGSGSTMFGIFDDEIEIPQLFREYRIFKTKLTLQ